jgi:hypothetical protein
MGALLLLFSPELIVLSLVVLTVLVFLLLHIRSLVRNTFGTAAWAGRWSRRSLRLNRGAIAFECLPLPAHRSLTIHKRKMSSVPREGRGGQPFIGGAVVAGGGDHRARPHARLLARAGDRASSPAKSSGSAGR